MKLSKKTIKELKEYYYLSNGVVSLLNSINNLESAGKRKYKKYLENLNHEFSNLQNLIFKKFEKKSQSFDNFLFYYRSKTFKEPKIFTQFIQEYLENIGENFNDN